MVACETIRLIATPAQYWAKCTKRQRSSSRPRPPACEPVPPDLVGFETIREDHFLLLKRLGEADHVAQLQHRAHRARGCPAVEAEITAIDYFADPLLGSAPVVYLAVESPGLEAIHADLTEAFETVDGLEGGDYVPHVTLARGGDLETAKRLADHEIEPIRWTVSGL